MNILTTELVNNYDYYKKLALRITRDIYLAEEAVHTAFIRLLGFKITPDNPAAYVTTHLKHVAGYQHTYTFTKDYVRTNAVFTFVSMEPKHERFMGSEVDTPLARLEAKEAVAKRYKTFSDYPGVQYYTSDWPGSNQWAAVYKRKRIGRYKTKEKAIEALEEYKRRNSD